jgi:hypothetical protein
MTYLPTMGTIDSTHFNSTRYPGVCKPTDFPTLEVFKEMQYQLDRLAEGRKLAKIAIDGDIGPGTMKLVKATGPWMMVDTSSCASVAQYADVISAGAQKKADDLGVPAKITTPATFAKPSILAPTGAIVVAPPGQMGAGASIGDAFKGLGTAGMLAVGAAIVGIGYFVTTKMKKAK